MRSDNIRIGRIAFTNVWPVFYHFPYDRFREETTFLHQVPTGLNEAMARGDIDMGPISSFAYGEAGDRYVLLPDLSVSALGRVNSILLFHREPLEHIAEDGTIALPTTSATSVNLLKIMIAKYYRGRPSYHYAAPNLEAMMASADAALLIGDDAIRAHWDNERTPRYRQTDLGELWHRLTGQWMTFAVWAVRREVAERRAELLGQLHAAFAASKRQAAQDPSAMIAEAVRAVGGTEAYWRGYFGQLCSDFGAAQQEGLRLYFRYAWELGLLARPAGLHIWNAND